MTTGLILTVLLATLIGVSLGLLGGGGSILAVPLLVYVADLPVMEAIATSLLVVGVTSVVGILSHARARRIRWRTGLLFGLAGMAGAYVGGRLAEHLPAGLLLTAFAVVMLATSVAMIRGPRATGERTTPRERPPLRTSLDGVLVGLVTGLLGTGGGFLVVPALALRGGLPMPVAVGTSLVVIAMNSVAGLAGHLAAVRVDWGLAAAVTTAAILGSAVSARFAGRIPAETLRRLFGWLVAAMGILVIAQQLPDALRIGAVLTTVALATLAAMALRARRSRPSRAGFPLPGRSASAPTNQETL